MLQLDPGIRRQSRQHAAVAEFPLPGINADNLAGNGGQIGFLREMDHHEHVLGQREGGADLQAAFGQVMQRSFNILSGEAALLLPLVHGQVQLDAQADPVGAAALRLLRSRFDGGRGDGQLHPVLITLNDG
ncbi:hypothetical protein D3C76_1557280 [compost metagenome]